jgi:hypothetical protein
VHQHNSNEALRQSNQFLSLQSSKLVNRPRMSSGTIRRDFDLEKMEMGVWERTFRVNLFDDAGWITGQVITANGGFSFRD